MTKRIFFVLCFVMYFIPMAFLVLFIVVPGTIYCILYWITTGRSIFDKWIDWTIEWIWCLPFKILGNDAKSKYE